MHALYLVSLSLLTLDFKMTNQGKKSNRKSSVSPVLTNCPSILDS